MSTHKCFSIAFVVLYLCSYGYCFNKTKILGTWIVTNTSQPSENNACPFVKIQNSSSLTVTYESKAFNIALMVNESKSSLNPFEDEKTANRNFTIYGGIFPYYMVVGVRIKKEIPSFLIMTSSLNPLPKDVRRNITDLIAEIEELKNIHFSTVATTCKKYIEEHVENPYRKFVNPKIEHISWSDTTDSTDPPTTMDPPTTIPTTTKKPNAASALFVSNFIVLISMLFVFAQ